IIINQINSLVKNGGEISLFTIKSGIYNYLKSIFTLRKVIRKNTFEILHAHYGWCGVVTFLADRNTPLIISFMGDDLMGVVGKKGHYSIPGKLVVAINIFFAKFFFDFSIVKSKALENKLKGVSNTAIIPNGVDVMNFIPKQREAAKKKIQLNPDYQYIIWVSDPLRNEKNFRLAKNAVALLNQPDIRLLPVYNMPVDNLIWYYSAADCLLLTSFHEGSPNVIKEAMACNLPIVSTDVGDVKWIIGKTKGCYVTSFDPNDVADKLKKALLFRKQRGNTDGRSKLIQLGLDSDSIALQIIKLYKNVLLDSK
ncbi:glycosyltransferase family 4 protein, partial [Bacteroidota bacterium]